MVEKEERVVPSPGLIFNYKGVFDFSRLYGELKEWFLKNDYEFQEKEFTEKSKDLGYDYKYVFEGMKEVTEYYKFKITLTAEMKEVNPMSENLASGQVRIIFTGKMELDYKNRWQKTAFVNFLFKLYNEYLIRNQIEAYRYELYEDVMELHDLAKDVLDFNR